MSGSAWSNQIVSRVIIAGANGQELVYDQAPPVFGHLIASILGANFTDPYGNLGLAGITGYGNIGTPSIHFLAVQIINNGIYISTSVTEAGPWTQIARVVFAQPASVGTANTGLLLQNNNSAAQLILAGNDSAGAGRIVALSSFIHRNDPNAVNAVEGWHAMSLLNGWANQPGNTAARYRLLPAPANCVQIEGVLVATAATAGTFFTLPSGYVPAGVGGFGAGANGGVTAGQAPQIRWDASGNLSINSVATGAANSVWITGLVILDS